MREFFTTLMRRRLVRFGVCALAALALLAVAIPLLSPYDPNALDIAVRLRAPSATHWFGTDEFGRDVLTRVLFGGRYSLAVGALVVLIATVCGVAMGLVAGFFSRLDAPVMRLVDALMALPDILLAIALLAILGA